MDNNYKIFAKGFNKTLDMLDNFKKVSNLFKRVVDIIPKNVVEKFSSCEDYPFDGGDYHIELARMTNEVSIDFTRYKNYLHAEVSVHRIFEDDMSPNKLFSIYIRNVPQKAKALQIYYQEEGGKVHFVGTNDENYLKTIDIKYEISFDYDENKQPYLILKTYFRGQELTDEVHYPISFDELAQIFEDEDPYEEDWTVEFDADFDL